MIDKSLIFGIIGGLGLFIFGIKIMSDGLKKVAGEKMRRILTFLTAHRFKGLILGTIVTSIIQSSSATVVMLIGFVNAGLMTLVQAIPVILGANIGTTITAQLIAFKLTDYALPIVAIGVTLNMFAKKKTTQQLGEAILGFGVLFLGLSIMAGSVEVLGNGSAIHNIFAKFSHNIFLGIIVGTIVTGILQSSSVTTGIIIVMATMGLLDLKGAIPLVFGANIGTCVTALLASLGTNLTAKRTAFAHIIQKSIGAIIGLSMFSFYLYFIPKTSHDLARQVANSHTLFNIITSSLFIGFVPLYARFIEKIIPGEEILIEHGPKYLAKSLLNTPAIAIDAAKKEIMRMMLLTKEMVELSMDAFRTGNNSAAEKVLVREDMIDELRDSIANYLIRITEREITETEAKMIPSFLHSINDIERIGDHAENIAELALRMTEKKIIIPTDEIAEINTMYKIVDGMMHKVIDALSELDIELTHDIFQKERDLNRKFMQYRESHVGKLNSKQYQSFASIVYTDMLANFEKIGDHITNVAQAIHGKFLWNMDDVF
ncbi:MAG: Na/Pi cotransporter family protein [bacterium]